MSPLLLDQREHVAHPRMRGGGHPLGMEDVEVGELLPRRREHDRLPGHVAHRQRGTAAGVTVELGEYDTAEADAVAERLGRRDRVLAIIASTTNSVSSGCTASRIAAACAIISPSMPSRPAVSTTTTSYILCRASSTPRRATATGSPTRCRARARRPRRRPARRRSAAGHRVGALQVGGDQQRRVALALEPAAQLAGKRGLTGALQAGEHDHGRRILGELHPPRLAAQDADQLLVDDLDDLLCGVQRLGDLGPAGALPYAANECLDRGQRDVGLEQRDPDLAQVASMSASESLPLPRRDVKTFSSRRTACRTRGDLISVLMSVRYPVQRSRPPTRA